MADSERVIQRKSRERIYNLKMRVVGIKKRVFFLRSSNLLVRVRKKQLVKAWTDHLRVGKGDIEYKYLLVKIMERALDSHQMLQNTF